MIRDRKQPHRRPKVNDYNNSWLKKHPEVNRETQRRWRERQRAQPAPSTVPPHLTTVREAMAQLGVRSRFRVTQLIDQGRLNAIKVHGRWLIVREDLDLLIAERVLSYQGEA
jgi:excisionase family DNA binding protein